MKRARAAGSMSLDVGVSDKMAATSALEFLDPFQVEHIADASASPADARERTAVRRDRVGSAMAAPLDHHMAGLVQRIFLAPDHGDDVVRTVIFAGVNAGDRSAAVAASCAETLLACVTGRICLVDANLDDPSLHLHYNLANDIGLAEVLGGGAPLLNGASQLKQTEQSSLWLLPAGSAWSSSGALLTADPTRGRFQEMMRSFDYVIVAAPAVSRLSAASILGAQVDGVILVVEANVTRRHVARSAATSLRASGARVLGTVLKNRTFPIPDAIYRLL